MTTVTNQKIKQLLNTDGFNESCHDCSFYQEWGEYPFVSNLVCDNDAECECEDDRLCVRLRLG